MIHSQKVHSFNFAERIIIPIIIGIIIGLAVSFLWQYFNSVKSDKIYLFDIDRRRVDPNKQVFPDISVSPIEIKLSSLKRGIVKLGILNGNKKTLKNGILFITFPEGVQVIGGDLWNSNGKSYVYNNLGNINPETALVLLPLELEFLELKTYEATYSIAGEDFGTGGRKLLIKAIK